MSNKTYSIELNEQQLQHVVNVLAQAPAPYVVTHPIMEALQQQIEAQETLPPAEPEAEALRDTLSHAVIDSMTDEEIKSTFGG